MMFLFKLFARLPLPVVHALGVVVGWLIYWGPGRHSARMRDNITLSGLCDPGAQCRRLLRQNIRETGKGIAELAVMWLRPYDRVLRLVRGTTGFEHIEAARAAGKGIIVMSPHIGCFEIIGQHLALNHPFTVMYRPPRQAVLDDLMKTGRQRGHATLVPADLSGVRALLGALKRHETIGVLPDQVATRGDGAWAPFFGRPAYTPTMVASLQRKTGAVAVFAAAERLSWGRGYHLHVFPLDAPLAEDKAEAAAQVNAAVEAVVRRFPAQYLWSYNPYKRPAGVPAPGEDGAA